MLGCVPSFSADMLDEEEDKSSGNPPPYHKSNILSQRLLHCISPFWQNEIFYQRIFTGVLTVLQVGITRRSESI